MYKEGQHHHIDGGATVAGRDQKNDNVHNTSITQAGLAEQLKHLNWVNRPTKTEPCEEEQSDKKICPMPSCKNEVRRGRYCNSCQKRKESLNKSLAQQGIRLPTQRKVRSSSIDNLSAVAPIPFVAGKHRDMEEHEQLQNDMMIGSRKKYRTEDHDGSLPHASELLSVVGTLCSRTMPELPFSSMQPRADPFHPAEDRLSRSSSLSSLNESGFSSNYHSNSSSTMSINSLLSPPSPTQDRSRSSSFSDGDSMDIDTPRPTGRYFTMEDQVILQRKIMEDRIAKLDDVIVELAGGEQQASRLLRKYLTSPIGKMRLSGQNPNGQ